MVFRIHFTTEDLARTKVADAPMPLLELKQAARALQRTDQPARLSGWRRHARARLSAEARLALDFIPPVGWSPTFIGPPRADGPAELIEQVRATSPGQIRKALTTILPTTEAPSATRHLTDPDFLGRLCDGLSALYDVLLAPYWPAMADAFTADRSVRVRQSRSSRATSTPMPRRSAAATSRRSSSAKPSPLTSTSSSSTSPPPAWISAPRLKSTDLCANAQTPAQPSSSSRTIWRSCMHSATASSSCAMGKPSGRAPAPTSATSSWYSSSRQADRSRRAKQNAVNAEGSWRLRCLVSPPRRATDQTGVRVSVPRSVRAHPMWVERIEPLLFDRWDGATPHVV